MDGHSGYGKYDVSGGLELSLPGTRARFERLGERSFFYSRQDAEGNTAEKMIPAKSDSLQVELAPIRPLNHPARRTSHVFLKFDKEIHLGGESAASIHVRCPIEIGVFLVDGEHRESLDWVTCNHARSRFGLYGPPDTGTLCKYAEVQLASGLSDSVPYVEGVMSVLIENTLSESRTVSKVIFPVTDSSVYYDGSSAALDGITVTLKKRAAVSVADVQSRKLETGWTMSPTWEDSTANTAMEMGLE